MEIMSVVEEREVKRKIDAPSLGPMVLRIGVREHYNVYMLLTIQWIHTVAPKLNV